MRAPAFPRWLVTETVVGIEIIFPSVDGTIADKQQSVCRQSKEMEVMTNEDNR